MSTTKYINNDAVYGIEYDWKKIRKKYKKLGCPSELYNPCKIPFESCKYNVLLSERATGKTTNLLLVGMIMNWEYGTIIQYIRQRDMMIAPKITRELYEVIKNPAYGYIEKITDGQYNTIVYKSRRWYFAKCNDMLEVEEVAPNHFCYMLSLDDDELLKSGYNCPTGDLILFDEFIGKYYRPNEFAIFCNIIKTIVRKRLSPVIVMLANTIDLYSPYYEDLEIADKIKTMRIGDDLVHTTEKGTSIYVELIGLRGVQVNKDKAIFNSKFFGFKNPRLSSITGEDWALEAYPKPPEKSKTIQRGFYIKYSNKLCAIDVCYHDSIGYFCICHFAHRSYDDSLIIIDGCVNAYNEIFDFKETSFSEKILKMYKINRFYYANNMVGNFVTSFMKVKGVISKY